MEKKFKLKKGDRVWVRLPTNATVTKISKQGYTLKAEDGMQYEWFGDGEVDPIAGKTKAKLKANDPLNVLLDKGRGWAITGNHGLYIGWWLNRSEAIAQHTKDLGKTWQQCKRDGDFATRIKIITL